MKKEKNLSILINNTVPFLGVLFLNWSLFTVLFSYCMEMLVMFIFNIPKILKAEKVRIDMRKKWRMVFFEYAPINLSFILSGMAVVLYLGGNNIQWMLLIYIPIIFIINYYRSYKEYIKKREYLMYSSRDQVYRVSLKIMIFCLLMVMISNYAHNKLFDSVLLLLLFPAIKSASELIMRYVGKDFFEV